MKHVLGTHGSPELDEDALKLEALGADPGPKFMTLRQYQISILARDLCQHGCPGNCKERCAPGSYYFERAEEIIQLVYEAEKKWKRMPDE